MRVGADIQSTCRKCGVVWHLVIAMNDGRIAKVECGDCGARHGYRGIGSSARSPRSTASGRVKRTGTSGRGAQIIAADPTRPRRPFRTTETYELGDRVTHPHFGEGVVQALIGNTKVEILFELGSKTMVQGRSSGS